MPKISVIMPAYNAEQYIGEAMDSILGQTFGDFEFIILNDCSTDGTEEIILSYDDPRIVYLKNENNLGVAATLNRGLEMARGEYIARMDADDISLPQRFEKQIAYLDAHPEVAVLGTAVETFGDRNQTIGFSQTNEKLKVDLLFGSCFAHPSVIMRTAIIRSLGGYDREYEGLEDYDLWCRVSEKHALATLSQVLLRYRVHPAQVTQTDNPGKQLRYCRLQKRIVRQLGIETDDTVFHAWCNISKGDPDTLVACMGFFRRIIGRNQSLQIYDAGYLYASAEAAILRYVDRMPLKQAFSVMRRCGVNFVSYAVRRLRHYIKR